MHQIVNSRMSPVDAVKHLNGTSMTSAITLKKRAIIKCCRDGRMQVACEGNLKTLWLNVITQVRSAVADCE